jgi:hypothetical protein
MKQLPVFERENAGRQKACKSLTASQPRRPGFPKTEFVTPVPQGGGFAPAPTRFMGIGAHLDTAPENMVKKGV